MDLISAELYLEGKVREAPIGSPQKADYLARLRRIRNMIAWEEPDPSDTPDAA